MGGQGRRHPEGAGGFVNAVPQQPPHRILPPGWAVSHGERWMLLLRLTVSITLLAQGWLTFRWDSSLRSLVWQEDWWSTPLEKIFGIPWSRFAEQSEPALTQVLEGVGLFLIALSVAPWLTAVPRLRWTRWLLVPAGILLFLEVLGQWVSADKEVGMLIENALRVVTPFAFLIAWRSGPGRAWWLIAALAASLTFVGHGLYAAGFHAVPLVFQTMTMKILGCDQEAALLFLKIAGWLDFVAVLCLWLTPLRRWGLFYMIAWGGLTALARVWAHANGAAPWFGLDPWLAETLVRTPHWLLPLLLTGAGKQQVGSN